jgi:hypothetical protein
MEEREYAQPQAKT